MIVPEVASGKPSTEDRIRAALWFAERGFGVFSVWSSKSNGECKCPKGASCDSPGKHPVTPNGFKDATREPKNIRTMLSAGSQPNYGLVCPPGVFALDVDGDDLPRLANLELRLGKLPPTLRTLTANGQHVFLRWPDSLPAPLHKMFGFVTRWGSGRLAGYVIGPRSIHPSGFAYAPDGPFEIVEMPPAWADAALESQPGETVIQGPKALPDVGGRHDFLRDRARYYWGLTGDIEVTRAAVLAENAKLAQPKTAEEVERAIGEVQRFPVDSPQELEERVDRRFGDDELGFLGLPSSSGFPPAPSDKAFEGTIGSIVEELATGTDASLIGLLGSMLAFCGAIFPGQAYFHRQQTTSPFIGLVGESSIGRKGTAMNRVRNLWDYTIDIGTINRLLLDGIASGEALVISLVKQREFDVMRPVVALIFEEEFATTLAARGREGSTLDPRLRQAFDGGSLSHRKVADFKTLNPPYWLPALMAITPSELRARLEVGALQSGSASRWLYLPVVRRAVDPVVTVPQLADQALRDELFNRHQDTSKKAAELGVDPIVPRRLSEYSDFLVERTSGLSRDLTRRFAVFAFRIALVHATTEGARSVSGEHLERALAVTEYARHGIPWIFGDTVGDPNAAYLYRQLVEHRHLSTTQITRQIIRDPIKRQAAIDELLRLGQAQRLMVQTGGRSRVELIPATPDSAASFTYFHVPNFQHSEVPVSVETMERREISAQEPWKEAGNKVAESPPETVLCHFYREHQSKHRKVDGRWICDICSPPEPVA